MPEDVLDTAWICACDVRQMLQSGITAPRQRYPPRNSPPSARNYSQQARKGRPITLHIAGTPLAGSFPRPGGRGYCDGSLWAEAMVTEDQTSVVDLLPTPSGCGGAAVERIDTHASVVFVAGARAYKLKRAVRLDYLDFSTSERRQACCEAEVRLNRRTAPTLYRRVVAVTRERDGSFALGGTGSPADWVVEMHRFSQVALFDRLAEAGRLDLELMSPLGAAIAGFHLSAEHRADHGGRAGMRWVVEGNAAGFADFGGAWLDRAASDRVIRDTSRELERHRTSSNGGASQDSCGSATAIFICAISCSSKDSQRCSTGSSSTTRSPAATSSTISPSC